VPVDLGCWPFLVAIARDYMCAMRTPLYFGFAWFGTLRASVGFRWLCVALLLVGVTTHNLTWVNLDARSTIVLPSGRIYSHGNVQEVSLFLFDEGDCANTVNSFFELPTAQPSFTAAKVNTNFGVDGAAFGSSTSNSSRHEQRLEFKQKSCLRAKKQAAKLSDSETVATTVSTVRAVCTVANTSATNANPFLSSWKSVFHVDNRTAMWSDAATAGDICSPDDTLFDFPPFLLSWKNGSLTGNSSVFNTENRTAMSAKAAKLACVQCGKQAAKLPDSVTVATNVLTVCAACTVANATCHPVTLANETYDCSPTLGATFN
jgi:hypothetical protein